MSRDERVRTVIATRWLGRGRAKGARGVPMAGARYVSDEMKTTVGTLGAERLEEIEYERVVLGEDEDIAALMDHIDALTAQLERARGIAVSLEQELAAVRRQSYRLIEELHTENDALAWRRLYWECWAGEQEQAVNGATAVHALHQRIVWPLCECDPPHGQSFCEHCLDLSGRHQDAVWPCATIRAIEENS